MLDTGWERSEESPGGRLEAVVEGAVVLGKIGGLEHLFPLPPRGSASGWVIFEIPETAQPVWLRATPSVPHESVLPNHLYFEAK